MPNVAQDRQHAPAASFGHLRARVDRRASRRWRGGDAIQSTRRVDGVEANSTRRAPAARQLLEGGTREERI